MYSFENPTSPTGCFHGVSGSRALVAGAPLLDARFLDERRAFVSRENALHSIHRPALLQFDKARKSLPAVRAVAKHRPGLPPTRCGSPPLPPGGATALSLRVPARFGSPASCVHYKRPESWRRRSFCSVRSKTMRLRSAETRGTRRTL